VRTPTDDRALLARSRDGDTDAFRELFDRKHRRVYLIAYQVLGDTGQAEDVTQEVFLSLWERCAQYDDSFPLDAWLRRIAINRAIDFWRSRKAERRHLAAPIHDDDAGPTEAARAPSAGATDPESLVGRRELQVVWDNLAADLSPQQRAAFVLRHIEGLGPDEVADALGCSASTVRSHISEARRTLRAALRERYPELVDGN
jgi:RNA polymerase sigma-70 factor (ECF subfamily)